VERLIESIPTVREVPGEAKKAEVIESTVRMFLDHYGV